MPPSIAPLVLISPGWHSFFRSYGVKLQSSLTMVIPLTLAYSARLPVSVSGTGALILPSSFSRQHGVNSFASVDAPHQISALKKSGFAYSLSLLPWTDSSIRRLYLASCVTTSVITSKSGAGMSTCCPSTTPFSLALGPA